MSASQFEAFIRNLRRRLEPVNLYLVAALVISIIAAWPLISQTGFLNTRGGGDSPFLLQRVQQLGSALADGHFPVRWMPDAGYGYGYPFFNYYAPLSIYLATALNFLGFGLVWAIKIAQLIGFIVAAWAMFSLGRRWIGSNWAGLLASATYTLAPFHMVNVYVRGDSLAEFWAMALFPLVILLADALARTIATGDHKQTIRAAVLFGLGYAALIISHNISALIFTPFLLLYVLLVILVKEKAGSSSLTGTGTRRSIVLWTFAAFTFGLALSAWFWLPALADQSLAQLDPVTSGYFHFDNHFRNGDLIQSSLTFNYDISNGKSFSMGFIQATLALAGLAAMVVYFWKARRDEPDSIPDGGKIPVASGLFIVISLIIATLMITALSRPLWENLPLLGFTQFPWRFLSIQAFAAALATAGLALLPGRRILVPMLVILLLVTSMVNLRLDFLDIGDEDVTDRALAEYEWFTGNIGSTVSAEYLPDSVLPRPFTSSWLNGDDRDTLQILKGELVIGDLVERRTTRQEWVLETTSPLTEVTFPTLYWPGWKAEAGGEAVNIWPAPGSGLITMELTAGIHQIEIRLTRTPVRWIGELISLAALIIVVALLVWSRRRKLKWMFPLAGLGIIFLILGLSRIWFGSTSAEGDLSWDFPQLAFLHHAPDGITFSDGTILGSYKYDLEEVVAGEDVRVTLLWDRPPDTSVVVDLVTPAVNRFRGTPHLATQTIDSNSDQVEFDLKIPSNAPAGLYMPRLVIDGASSLTSSGQLRGDLYLRPIRIIDAPDLALSDGATLEARAVTVQRQHKDVLEVQLQWLAREVQTNNFNFSLRLVDEKGAEVARTDGQPGYGFLPSSLWQKGQWTDDWISLPLPADIETMSLNSPYALVVRLYEVDTGEVALVQRLGELNWRGENLNFDEKEASFVAPDIGEIADVTFGDVVRLGGYDQFVSEDTLTLVLYWKALEEGLENYYHFIHLIDPISGEIMAQHDSMPRFDTYPTSQWSLGEVVLDPAEFDLGELTTGSYQLAVGLYKDLGVGQGITRFQRLVAVDGEGSHLPDNRFFLPDDVIIDR
jgi:hypothetical protein